MATKSDTSRTLQDVTDKGAVPQRMIANLAGELSGKDTDFIKDSNRMRIDLRWTESGRKNQIANYRAVALILISTPAGKLNLFKDSIVFAVA